MFSFVDSSGCHGSQLPAALPAAALCNDLVSKTHMTDDQLQFDDQYPTAKAKQRKKKQPQVSKEESCWWKKFLTEGEENLTLQLEQESYNSDSKIFCSIFQVPYNIFRLYVSSQLQMDDMIHPRRIAPKKLPCKHPDLLLVGVLSYTSATDASSLDVIVSNEMHQRFSLLLTAKFAGNVKTIKH